MNRSFVFLAILFVCVGQTQMLALDEQEKRCDASKTFRQIRHGPDGGGSTQTEHAGKG